VSLRVDLAFALFAVLTLGALVAVLGSRLRAARAVARTAREINDDVIQSLALAKYALERGDVAEAGARVDETLREAREIVERLVEPEHVRAGDLRRDHPPRVR
jgi:acyl-coenzyme A synthetase/AMP-(fatty) acid ligase